MIQLQNITKYFKSEKPLFDNLKIEAELGETILIEGISKSGKTTLLQILCGMILPDQGDVLINERSVISIHQSAKPYFIQHFGLVLPDQLQLLKSYSVIDNIALPLLIKGISVKKARQTAMVLLDKLGATNISDDSPSTIDKQSQLITLWLRAIAHQPKIILADDFDLLDEQMQSKIFNLINKLNNNQPTIFISSKPKTMAETIIFSKIISLDSH